MDGSDKIDGIAKKIGGNSRKIKMGGRVGKNEGNKYNCVGKSDSNYSLRNNNDKEDKCKG